MLTPKDFELVRGNRKTVGMELTREGKLRLRIPMRMTRAQLDLFFRTRGDWIEKSAEKLRKAQAKRPPRNPMSPEELQALAREALRVIPARVAHFAPLVGVDYGRITIRCQKTKWGSCTAKGNLNFNCLLMLAPPEVLDSVVVHELCHRLELNHSPRFYQEVLRVMPDYRVWDKWLKENGAALMARLP